MKQDSSVDGFVIGIAVALPLATATASALKRLPDANLVKFGPTLFGFVVSSRKFSLPLLRWLLRASSCFVSGGNFAAALDREPAVRRCRSRVIDSSPRVSPPCSSRTGCPAT
jgi:hypothetical protein